MPAFETLVSGMAAAVSDPTRLAARSFPSKPGETMLTSIAPIMQPVENVGVVIWVASISLCLYTCIAVIVAWELASSPGRSVPPVPGTQRRRNFVMSLLVASGARIFSLGALLAMCNGISVPFFDRGASPEELQWSRDLIALLPDVFFLSAYSVVVLFWAQVHYATTMVSIPFLDCLFICINIGCYIVVTAVAVCTFLLQAYDHLWTYMTCIVGILNVVLGLALLYYGLMVVSGLSETAKKKLPSRGLVPRVCVLSIVCPLTFIIRGFWYFGWDMELGTPTLLADLILCLLSEWLPSVITLVVLDSARRVSPKAAGLDSVGDSTDSEAPLLQDEQPPTPPSTFLSGERGLSWKQLYPQPAAP